MLLLAGLVVVSAAPARAPANMVAPTVPFPAPDQLNGQLNGPLNGQQNGQHVDESALARHLDRRSQEARRVASSVGIHVIDLASGRSIYELQADQPRIPASNVKLISTAAALDRLGPGYFHETPLLVSGTLVDGVLSGQLAVLGGGDPNISGRHHDGDSLQPLRRWGERLYQLGVREIASDVLLVDGYFAGERVHPTWPKDQLDRWYEAPVEALSFNDNCILVRVSPARAAGQPARIEVEPDVGIVEVRSNARTTAPGQKQFVYVGREFGSDLVEVSGTVRVGAEPVEAWITIDDPTAYFGAAMKTAFAQAGVTLENPPRAVASLPDARWRRVAVHRTDLLTTLEVTNKRSQNFYAESLLKVLGARFCGAGDWSRGVLAIEGFLTQAGLEPGSYRLVDGSGMSRENRFSARHLTTLLRHMFFHRWGREFVATLPYSGEEGLSWQKRLAVPPYRGNVYAKTGTLNGVSSLSGYAKARSGRLYAFSVLLNGSRGDGLARRTQDSLVRALIDHG